MSRKNTRRNKCMKCGEYYKSSHFCPSGFPKTNETDIKVLFSTEQDPASWGVDGVAGTWNETTIIHTFPGSGYAYRQSFDNWFAPIEKYVEGRL